MAESVETYCACRVLDHDIHEFVILAYNRAGADALIAAMQQMDAVLPPGAWSPVLALNWLMGQKGQS